MPLNQRIEPALVEDRVFPGQNNRACPHARFQAVEPGIGRIFRARRPLRVGLPGFELGGAGQCTLFPAKQAAGSRQIELIAASAVPSPCLPRPHISINRSWISPVAKALIKAREGDRVALKTPGGTEEFEILEVSYNPID